MTKDAPNKDLYEYKRSPVKILQTMQGSGLSKFYVFPHAGTISMLL